MNYATIKFCDVANGPGVRISLFVSGCEHYCKDCFNSEAWDFKYGKEYTDKTNEMLFHSLGLSFYTGLSILGGEPMHPNNQMQVLEIVKEFRATYPDKNLWLYSGYLYEELISGKIGNYSKEILEYVDVLVDGPFKLELKDIGLNFRGSSNQRIIDVPKSIASNSVVLHPLGIGDKDKYLKGENLI